MQPLQNAYWRRKNLLQVKAAMSPRSHRTGKARRFGGVYASIRGAGDTAGVPAAVLLMHK